METSTLTVQEIRYLDSLSPEDRDQLRRSLLDRKNRPPAETLDSLTAKLSELNKQPFHHREEKRKIMAEMDRKLKIKAETQLGLFINNQFEKGGAIDTAAIKRKAQSLGLEYEDIVPHIHLVQQIRRIGRGSE